MPAAEAVAQPPGRWMEPEENSAAVEPVPRIPGYMDGADAARPGTGSRRPQPRAWGWSRLPARPAAGFARGPRYGDGRLLRSGPGPLPVASSTWRAFGGQWTRDRG